MSYYWQPYSQRTVVAPSKPKIVKGRGIYVYDEGGRDYLDGIAGSYNHSLGFGDPELRQVISEQYEKLDHFCNVHADTLLPEELSQTLAQTLGPEYSKVFLTGSGSEAVECALKMARLFHSNQGAERPLILALDGGYHGCTAGAMHATQMDFMNFGLEYIADGFTIRMPVPGHDEDWLETLNRWEEVLAQHGNRCAAAILEPIMGLAGSRVLPSEFVQSLKQLLDRHAVLMIADEVFTGIGRAGAHSYSRHQKIEPDIVCFSKSLGAGFPIGATVAKESVVKAFDGPSALEGLRHGHTNTGHLLGCAAGIHVLERLERDQMLDKIRLQGELLKDRLKKSITLLTDRLGITPRIQGEGLMIGIIFGDFEVTEKIRQVAMENRLILGGTGDNLKVAPSLLFSESDCEEFMSRWIVTLEQCQKL